MPTQPARRRPEPLNAGGFRQRVKNVQAAIEALQQMFLLLSRWIPPSEERVISAKIGGRPVEPFTYSQLAQALVDHMKKLLSDFAANVGDYHDDSLFADPSKRDACLAAQRALEDLFEGPKPYSKLLKANVTSLARFVLLETPYTRYSGLDITRHIYMRLHNKSLKDSYIAPSHQNTISNPTGSVDDARRGSTGEHEESDSDDDGARSTRSRSRSVGHSLAHGARSARRGGVEQVYGGGSVYFPMARARRW